jgi:hypothetical protein
MARDSTNIEDEIIENSQKFGLSIGSHHRQYNGTAFYMDDDLPVKFNVDDQVMINAEFFRASRLDTRGRPMGLDRDYR